MAEEQTRELWQRVDREGPTTADYEWAVFDTYAGAIHWYEQEANARAHLETGQAQYERGDISAPDSQPRTEKVDVLDDDLGAAQDYLDSEARSGGIYP